VVYDTLRLWGKPRKFVEHRKYRGSFKFRNCYFTAAGQLLLRESVAEDPPFFSDDFSEGSEPEAERFSDEERPFGGDGNAATSDVEDLAEPFPEEPAAKVARPATDAQAEEFFDAAEEENLDSDDEDGEDSDQVDVKPDPGLLRRGLKPAGERDEDFMDVEVPAAAAASVHVEGAGPIDWAPPKVEPYEGPCEVPFLGKWNVVPFEYPGSGELRLISITNFDTFSAKTFYVHDSYTLHFPSVDFNTLNNKLRSVFQTT
jgi:hypothetical protein